MEDSLQSGVQKILATDKLITQYHYVYRQNGCIFVVESNDHRIQLFIIPPVDEWVSKGTLFLSPRKYNEALECFNKSIEIDQKYAYAWINKGKSLIHKGSYQDTIKSFDDSILVMVV
jgi:tetratricopeptide (TPR) repeat protein